MTLLRGRAGSFARSVRRGEGEGRASFCLHPSTSGAQPEDGQKSRIRVSSLSGPRNELSQRDELIIEKKIIKQRTAQLFENGILTSILTTIYVQTKNTFQRKDLALFLELTVKKSKFFRFKALSTLAFTW